MRMRLVTVASAVNGLLVLTALAAPAASASPALYSITATITTGSNPTDVEPCGGYIFAAKHGDSTLQAIDPSTNALVGSPIQVGSNPYGITCDNGFVYTANYASNNMSIVDASTRTVVGTVSAGGGASDVAISNGYAFVSNQSVGTVSVIDIAAQNNIATINVGGYPCGIAASGGKVYVSNLNSSAGTAIIDAATRTLESTISMPNAVRFMAAADGVLLFPTEGANLLLRASTSNPSSLTSISLPTQGTAAAIKDGKAYVTSFGHDRVFVVDLATNTVAATISLAASSWPAGISTYGTNAWVALQGAGQITSFAIGTPAPTAPGAPTAVSAVAGDSSADVSFTAPSSNGGSAITSYEVTSSPGSITATGSGSPISVSGLTNGTAYTFTVKAINAIGTGTASSASASVTPTGTQTIAFADPGTHSVDESLTLTAAATSGLAVSFSSSTSSVCTITTGGALSFLSTGICTITANQSGSAAYQAAPAVVRSFIVAAPQPAPASSGGYIAAVTSSPTSDSPTPTTSEANPPVDVAAMTALLNSKLPPAPAAFRVIKGKVGSKSTVEVQLRSNTAGTAVRKTVVVVMDDKNRIVSRISVSVKAGDSVVDVEVPYVAEGYTVHVYNVNDSGVSAGAVVGASASRASTVGFRDADGLPRLLGTRVAKPVAFGQGSATLDAADKQQLRKVAAATKSQNRRLLITGFSSSATGEPTSISTSRARAVTDYLSEQGVRVWMKYWGAGKASLKGSARDRRVEIRVVNPGQPG